MAKNEVVAKDLGLTEIFKMALSTALIASVRVGVLADSAKGAVRPPGSDLTVAEIASVNEFGTEDGHIPARSFLRSTFDEQRERVTNIASELIGKVFDGRMQADHVKGLLGEYLASAIRAKIRSNVPPPNAPSTIIRKMGKRFSKAPRGLGGALAQVGRAAAVKTLIDTGRMLNAVTWAVDGDKK